MKGLPLSISQYGFTLLELLLALVLSTLLITALTVAVSSITRDWEQQETWLAAELDDSLAFLQIERALHGMFPHLYRNPETNEEELWFRGDAETLAWVTTVSPDRRSGLSAWRLENDPAGITVRMAPVFAHAPDAALENAEPRLLLANLRMQIHYLQADADAKQEIEWQAAWQYDRLLSLPRAIRIDFYALDEASVKSPNHLENLHLLVAIKAWRHPRLQPLLEL